MEKRTWIPAALFAGFLVEFVVLGIHPVDRVIWVSENFFSVVPVLILATLYIRGHRFSNTAYALMTLFFVLHTIGGHYTFEKVPFGWITDLFGFERNHFDRICHFLVGVFAYPVLEYCDRKHVFSNHAAASVFVVMSVFGFAAIFELVEWIYAVVANPDAGSAFLGSQGDIWDAQKDMLSDGLGSICITTFYGMKNWRKPSTAAPSSSL